MFRSSSHNIHISEYILTHIPTVNEEMHNHHHPQFRFDFQPANTSQSFDRVELIWEINYPNCDCKNWIQSGRIAVIIGLGKEEKYRIKIIKMSVKLVNFVEDFSLVITITLTRIILHLIKWFSISWLHRKISQIFNRKLHAKPVLFLKPKYLLFRWKIRDLIVYISALFRRNEKKNRCCWQFAGVSVQFLRSPL